MFKKDITIYVLITPAVDTTRPKSASPPLESPLLILCCNRVVMAVGQLKPNLSTTDS